MACFDSLVDRSGWYDPTRFRTRQIRYRQHFLTDLRVCAPGGPRVCPNCPPWACPCCLKHGSTRLPHFRGFSVDKAYFACYHAQAGLCAELARAALQPPGSTETRFRGRAKRNRRPTSGRGWASRIEAPFFLPLNLSSLPCHQNYRFTAPAGPRQPVSAFSRARVRFLRARSGWLLYPPTRPPERGGRARSRQGSCSEAGPLPGLLGLRDVAEVSPCSRPGRHRGVRPDTLLQPRSQPRHGGG
jgi:hypothetical protein